ncbi:hypothetical protein MRX96_013578 [Rhipicephalus microplus]
MVQTSRNAFLMKSAKVCKSVGPRTTKATIRKAPQHEQGDGRDRNKQAQHPEPTKERQDPDQVEHHALAHRTEQIEPPEPVLLGKLVGGTRGASACLRSATAHLRIK